MPRFAAHCSARVMAATRSHPAGAGASSPAARWRRPAPITPVRPTSGPSTPSTSPNLSCWLRIHPLRIMLDYCGHPANPPQPNCTQSPFRVLSGLSEGSFEGRASLNLTKCFQNRAVESMRDMRQHRRQNALSSMGRGGVPLLYRGKEKLKSRGSLRSRGCFGSKR